MTCPPEIAKIILEILETGILRIRAAGWANDPARAAIEADHIHNLPALLRSYSTEGLRFYWDVERAGFLEHCNSNDANSFDCLWQALETAAFQPSFVPGEK